MTPNASVLSASPQLPNELYRNIGENLHYLTDRSTILHLALVSKAWCTESQRVLFRTVGDDPTSPEEHEHLIQTHTLFLEAIISNPSRLGPYVQTYEQRGLICHPALAANSTLPVARAGSYLWNVTETALPAFVSLRHLLIVPNANYRWSPSSTSLLNGCAFTLKNLRWGFEPSKPSTAGPLVEFLRTQHGLMHLEVGYFPAQQDLSWLPPGVCPSLRSASCRLDCAAHVITKERKIVALAIGHPQRRPVSQKDLSALCRLQYLSISAAHRDLASEWGPIDLNIVLLELTSWDIETARSLPGLPKLRVLALVREGPLHPYDAMLRIQLTIQSYRRCPTLEYVVIEDTPRVVGRRRYKKLCIAGSNGGSDAIPDIQSEDFPVEHEPGRLWWTAYGV